MGGRYRTGNPEVPIWDAVGFTERADDTLPLRHPVQKQPTNGTEKEQKPPARGIYTATAHKLLLRGWDGTASNQDGSVPH